ncbi:glycosyltransferase family 2 protein [Prochlorococcus sp. MIT 1341]|uniref:glycosyltransferase family 2 protein n=1 Tax=Prochlorococcus sp. MIT 1341 TaxID=3096221 RepID=UPI002A7588F5|nr:glycosyltransferase family 2 protein [Prochlorococcus sp. MIT 1341]
MFVSVVIPTYNRLPILQKCLLALESQVLRSHSDDFEIILVDDGSTDGTLQWLQREEDRFPHLKLFSQEHGGPAKGRNHGVAKSRGDVIIFIDSDLVVTDGFLDSHLSALKQAWKRQGNKLCFTYGSVINTSNFDNPTSEPHKISDVSWAYFATGNVAIDREILEQSGLFDITFCLYGWEDLELGERLRKMRVKLVRCPEAKGYHWHPSLTINSIPRLIRVEIERAKMGLVFYRKHPSRRVRFIIQFTVFHLILWELLTLGGLINERTLRPLLAWLIRRGKAGIAMELLRVPLNRIGVRALFREASLAGFHF